eukprot:508675_1
MTTMFKQTEPFQSPQSPSNPTQSPEPQSNHYNPPSNHCNSLELTIHYQTLLIQITKLNTKKQDTQFIKENIQHITDSLASQAQNLLLVSL